MYVTVRPLVIGTMGMNPQGLAKRQGDLEIRGPVETIKTMILLRSVRIL